MKLICQTVTKCRASHARQPQRQWRQRRQAAVPESHQVTKRRACHAGQPRRQRRQAALQGHTKCRACHARQPSVNGVQSRSVNGLETTESHQVPPATQRSRGVIGVQSHPWRIQRVTNRRACTQSSRGQRRPKPSLETTTTCHACHAKQPRRQRRPKPSLETIQMESPGSTASKAVLGDYRESPSAAPATQSSRGVNSVQSRPWAL